MQEKKKEMAKIIEATNKAYEQREKWRSEMHALKASADAEQAQFEGDWKKLGAVIDQDKRNRELLRQRDMEERNRKTQEVPPPPSSCGTDLARSEAVRAHCKLTVVREFAAAEEPGGCSGGAHGEGKEWQAQQVQDGRSGDHGQGAAAWTGLPEDPDRHWHPGAPSPATSHDTDWRSRGNCAVLGQACSHDHKQVTLVAGD